MKIVYRNLGLAVFSVLLLSCTGVPSQAGPNPLVARPMAPIPVRVLLLIPYEFESFSYPMGQNGETSRGSLGEKAVWELRQRLLSAFSILHVEPVSSESRAVAMLDPLDPRYPEVRRYDYLAIPRFMNVAGWNKPFQYGFDVDVLLELYRSDGSKVTKIHGHGETNTGSLAGVTPAESARLALTYAIEAIRESLAEKRHLFTAKD